MELPEWRRRRRGRRIGRVSVRGSGGGHGRREGGQNKTSHCGRLVCCITKKFSVSRPLVLEDTCRGEAYSCLVRQQGRRCSSNLAGDHRQHTRPFIPTHTLHKTLQHCLLEHSHVRVKVFKMCPVYSVGSVSLRVSGVLVACVCIPYNHSVHVVKCIFVCM